MKDKKSGIGRMLKGVAFGAVLALGSYVVSDVRNVAIDTRNVEMREGVCPRAERSEKLDFDAAPTPYGSKGWVQKGVSYHEGTGWGLLTRVYSDGHSVTYIDKNLDGYADSLGIFSLLAEKGRTHMYMLPPKKFSIDELRERLKRD